MAEIYATTPALGDCFECGRAAHFKHHVIPRSLGGKHTVTLCAECHGKVHNFPFVMDHGIRVRAGMVKARALGRLKGKRPKLSEKQQQDLWQMYESGAYSISALAECFAVSRPTVYRTLTRKTLRST